MLSAIALASEAMIDPQLNTPKQQSGTVKIRHYQK